MKNLINFVLAVALAVVVAAPAALAQQLKEIVVTATKRETSLQDVPISSSCAATGAGRRWDHDSVGRRLQNGHSKTTGSAAALHPAS